MRWLSAALLLLVLLAALVPCVSVAHAAAAPSAAPAAPFGFTGSAWASVPGVLPAATTPTPTCDATADPQTCADAFLQPFNRPFQIAILVLLSAIGGACLLTGLLGIARGVGGGLFNEPRWVSRALAGIGGVIMLFVVAVILVSVFGNLKGLVPTPSLPQLGG